MSRTSSQRFNLTKDNTDPNPGQWAADNQANLDTIDAALWRWRGAWSSAVGYYANDVVTTSNGLWLAIGASTNVAPGTDGTKWQQLLSAIAMNDFLGQVASQAAMLALTGQRGDWAIRTDFNPNRVYMLTGDDATQLANWQQASFGGVNSVNGATGDITGLVDTAGTGLVKSGTTLRRSASATGSANLAALPAASASNSGLLERTADGAIYESDGAAWQTVRDPNGTFVAYLPKPSGDATGATDTAALAAVAAALPAGGELVFPNTANPYYVNDCFATLPYRGRLRGNYATIIPVLPGATATNMRLVDARAGGCLIDDLLIDGSSIASATVAAKRICVDGDGLDPTVSVPSDGSTTSGSAVLTVTTPRAWYFGRMVYCLNFPDGAYVVSPSGISTTVTLSQPALVTGMGVSYAPYIPGPNVRNSGFINLLGASTLNGWIGVAARFTDSARVTDNDFDTISNTTAYFSSTNRARYLRNNAKDTGWYSVQFQTNNRNFEIGSNNLSGDLSTGPGFGQVGCRTFGAAINIMGDSSGNSVGMPIDRHGRVHHNKVSGVTIYGGEGALRITGHDIEVDNEIYGPMSSGLASTTLNVISVETRQVASPAAIPAPYNIDVHDVRVIAGKPSANGNPQRPWNVTGGTTGAGPISGPVRNIKFRLMEILSPDTGGYFQSPQTAGQDGGLSDFEVADSLLEVQSTNTNNYLLPINGKSTTIMENIRLRRVTLRFKSGADATLTDGATNGTTTFTSATAAFVPQDVGTFITETVPGTNFALLTYIESYVNATTVTLSQAALTTAAGVTFSLINRKGQDTSASHYAAYVSFADQVWIEDLAIEGMKAGVLFNTVTNLNKFSGTAMANTPASPSLATFTSTTEVYPIGGNPPGVAQYAGAGVPSFTAAAGSTFMRRDGSAGTRLYVTSGGGTWAAVAGV